MTSIQELEAAKEFIQSRMEHTPTVGLILGSGLGVLAEEITGATHIPYSAIPGFPQSTVAGHAGQLVIGQLNGVAVVAMQGRFHYYEGYTMKQVTFPVRVMKELGVQKLIVTNAAGGINEAFTPGDLMIITDHINNMGVNPLIGPNEDRFGVRFLDLSTAYSREMISIAKKVAEDGNLNVQTGIYVANTGPVYETPAEVKMLRLCGGDAVGMSTVPEVIVANHAGIPVLGISCISNMAAGILDQPLNHEEVIETTEKVKQQFLSFVKGIVTKI